MSARNQEQRPARKRRTGRGCPVCGKPATAAHHPFCSQRCRQIDLGRWLKGAYVIPGRPPGTGGEDAD
ncbi:MAG TPA: DNA gyrase inhibitor YacG [Kiloniellales bacterium]